MKVSEIVSKAASIKKSSERKKYEITVLEAGNMWNKLLARYDLVENILILNNHIKEEDLRKEVKLVLKKINLQARKLEKAMAEYSIPLMLKPPGEVNIAEDVAVYPDRYIYSRIFHSVKRFLPVHIVSFVQSTSLNLRKMFKGFLLEEMDMYERLQDFGLRKNWLQPQPEYRNGRSSVQERPSIMEVAQMWNKLIARYETMEFTNYMDNLTRDVDLKTAIVVGQGTLQEQILGLENMMQKYGAAVPERPPDAENTARPIDAITDRYIYRQMFRGIQSFLPIHMVAFQESQTPSVRKKFKSLLLEEIDIYDKFIYYGLLKDWVYKPPSFEGTVQ